MKPAERAFLAKQRVDKLDLPPEVMKEFEEESDKLHAFFSSLVAGTSLSRKELWRIIVEEYKRI